MNVHERVAAVTERIIERSRDSRRRYLDRIEQSAQRDNSRGAISCGNLAHVVAGCAGAEKSAVTHSVQPHIAIVTAYNDMLSAHVPYASYPAALKKALAQVHATAQVAGGVPAMCDGVTQGRVGMEVGLFSRDVIALSTAVALSHDVFDGVLLLGICDKIVPGLLIGALSFGHLPMLFVPAGPMPSGLPNAEKARVRQEYAENKIGRGELLAAEMESYHSPGTCTFYGTANSNQLVIEVMGLQLPGSSFVNPDTELRAAYTDAAAYEIAARTKLHNDYRPIGKVVDEKSIVNGIVALLATGGSTNLTIHLVAIAAAAGIRINWSDFSDLADVVPLLARVYPNGSADVNQFAAAGGIQFLVRELLGAGLLHGDVLTMAPVGDLASYSQQAICADGKLQWRESALSSGDNSVLRAVANPFQPTSGIKVLHGNLGEAVIKTSAVKPEHWKIEQPALVFDSQEQFLDAFQTGALDRDFIAVLRFQGPRANGMPELHKLTPSLGVLLDKGYKVALLTDGRMSGASGKVPAAIHLTPEALDGGVLARICDGDLIRIDAVAGEFNVLVDAAELAQRLPALHIPASDALDTGRILFGNFRRMVSSASAGATLFTDLLTD
ncbi:MAG: phosphogluconate dehydratase [Verrucomicrobiaceae bacterium]|nr:phosphogluconate dehydratase [Verrucomicrobiaceae bacterium]